MMKNRKFVVPLVSVYDCEKLENYLEKQAAKGWMLEKSNAIGLFLKKTEPKNVHFSVNFLPDGSMFESEKSEKYEEFKELSQHSGWELITISSPHMFFYSEQENPTPIETDPVLAVETVHNVTKKNHLPLLFLWSGVEFINCLLWLSLMILTAFEGDDILTILSKLFSGVASAAAGGLVLAEIVRYKRWHKKAVKLAEEENIFLSPKGKNAYILWGCFFAIAGMTFSILSININAFLHVFIALASVFVAVAIILCVNSIMRKLNVPTKTNRTITLIVGAVVMVATFFLGFLVGMGAIG